MSVPFWVHAPFDKSDPACERCGDSLRLYPDCEWDDRPGFNLCHHCALKVIGLLYKEADTEEEP